MRFPDFIDALPVVVLPFPEDIVSARAIRSDRGLVVFFTFHRAMDLPAHAHGPQWGTVVAGEIVFTIGGTTRTYRPGDSYSIAADEVHSARIAAGTQAIDVFAEADRYPLRA